MFTAQVSGFSKEYYLIIVCTPSTLVTASKVVEIVAVVEIIFLLLSV